MICGYHNDGYSTDVSEEDITSIFKVEKTKEETSIKQAASFLSTFEILSSDGGEIKSPKHITFYVFWVILQ
jgi:uncharacterized Fe-S cluster-containing MiaB family protein